MPDGPIHREDHTGGSIERFADLRAEIQALASMVRGLVRVAAGRVDEIAEHRRYMREIYARMEQHDAMIVEQNARIEAITCDIRRRLDPLERRERDG